MKVQCLKTTRQKSCGFLTPLREEVLLRGLLTRTGEHSYGHN